MSIVATEKRAPVRERAAFFIKAAFEALNEAGGSLPLRDVKAEVAKRVELSPHDLAVYEKSGYVRWESILHFFSIDCVKAGFIRKHGGKWHLTPEGRAVVTLSGKDILNRALEGYKQWKAAHAADHTAEETAARFAGKTGESVSDEEERSLVLEKAEDEARNEIREYVWALGPYDFQELVAALLRGMKFTTPFVAPLGPDGGTDVLAYPDPLGAQTPHIRVQVKHRKAAKATREEVAALRGIIRQDREIGLFVSSAGFTSEAIREARHGGVHIELMDLERLLDQWVAYYDQLNEEDKGLLRLRRVYFLAPD